MNQTSKNLDSGGLVWFILCTPMVLDGSRDPTVWTGLYCKILKVLDGSRDPVVRSGLDILKVLEGSRHLVVRSGLDILKVIDGSREMFCVP